MHNVAQHDLFLVELWADNAKMIGLTGCRPQWSIDEGLQATIDWFTNEDNLSKYKTDIYNV